MKNEEFKNIAVLNEELRMKNEEFKSIAVLLTCFNRREKTLKCLECLHAQLPIDGYRVDVYLTNDGCTDGTPEAVREQFPDVQIIHGDGNLYWNRGMYTAWKVAAENKDYDFYLWLNDDTYLLEGALDTLLKDADSTNCKAIICGATCSLETGEITYGGRVNGKLLTPFGKKIPCHFFNGNTVLISRYVYRKLGNLDYTFTHALGDFDYGMRANKAGIEIYQASKFIGTCEQHDSYPKWCNPQYSFRQRKHVFYSPLGGHPKENFYFERKHFNVWQAAFHYFTIHLRLILPKFWKHKNV